MTTTERKRERRSNEYVQLGELAEIADFGGDGPRYMGFIYFPSREVQRERCVTCVEDRKGERVTEREREREDIEEGRTSVGDR